MAHRHEGRAPPRGRGRESPATFAGCAPLFVTAAITSLCFGYLSLNDASKAYATHVDGYTKKDGTTVPAHERSAPNKTDRDNYDTKGNTNPYTGKEGTKGPKK